MKVLLATDRSSSAEKAADYLKELTFSEPVDLTVVSIVPPLTVIDAYGAAMPPVAYEVVTEQQASTEAFVAEVCKRFEGHVRSVNSIVATGSPSFEILSIAEQQEIDHLFLGAIGHSTVERILLGSVSDYVATHATCAVMVARPNNDSATMEPPSRILLCLDNSEDDIRLLNWMYTIQFPKTTEVHVVHVFETEKFYRQDLIEKASSLWGTAKDIADTHCKVIAKSIRRRGHEAVTSLLESSHIGECLLQYADEHACDLVVTGDHHRNILGRMLLGSTSRYLLRHANCSVAIARPRFTDEKSI